MKTWLVEFALDKICPDSIEGWETTLHDVDPMESQVKRAVTQYLTELGNDDPTASSFRYAVLAVIGRDRMRSESSRPQLQRGDSYGPSTEGRLWLKHIREEMTKIGLGGVPPEERKHTDPDWQKCPECKTVAREIAQEAAAIDKANIH